jgi:hypothetical protein
LRRISIVAVSAPSSLAGYAHVQCRCQVSHLRLPLLIQLNVSDGACFDLHAEHQRAKNALAGRAVPPSATLLLGYGLGVRLYGTGEFNYDAFGYAGSTFRSLVDGASEIISSIDNPCKSVFGLGAKELTPIALACILRCQS